MPWKTRLELPQQLERQAYARKKKAKTELQILQITSIHVSGWSLIYASVEQTLSSPGKATTKQRR